MMLDHRIQGDMLISSHSDFHLSALKVQSVVQCLVNKTPQKTTFTWQDCEAGSLRMHIGVNGS